MSEGKRYITRGGFRRLEREYEQLWKVERPKIVEEVATAAAHGDRSENAEYKYGKRKLREIDRRIRYLSRLLDRLTIVEPEESQAGRVFFGARVTVEDEEGEEHRYRIVGPDETDSAKGDISIESPIARALLRKAVDDEVLVHTPRGQRELTILAIDYDL
ncbi:MAG: transcription elongation factor GreB [Deltaproteobacteria bacterium]|nr:transcription elongation factor GreB [Deltaproteobacteria bacterium]